MKVITVYHNKGGVGKTTIVVNLGAGLARKGYRVLLIDLDSQANTTYATGLMKSVYGEEEHLRENNFSKLLETGYVDINDIVLRATYSSFPVDVVPSHISTSETEGFLQSTMSAPTVQNRLFQKLQKVKDQYDFVLLDTPPAIGLYARVALTSCDYLIIPSDMRVFANQGLRNVLKICQDVNEFRAMVQRENIRNLGVLGSKLSANPKFIQYTLPKLEQKITAEYSLPLFETKIYERSDLSKSVFHEEVIEGETPEGVVFVPNPKSIFDYDPD